MLQMSKNAEQCEILLNSWHIAFKRATDFDAWGQRLEASDIYQRLSRQMFEYVNNKNESLFSKFQKRTLEKIALCLEARRKSLMDNESTLKKGIGLQDLKLLNETLMNLHNSDFDGSDRSAFPIQLAATTFQSYDKSQDVLDEDERLAVDFPFAQGNATLLPKPLPVSGMSFVTVSIDQIGVKDGSRFLNPYISLSVRVQETPMATTKLDKSVIFNCDVYIQKGLETLPSDQSGDILDSVQETPMATTKLDKSVIFNCDVYIQKGLETLPSGFAIFFEFRHFKPKKDSYSTWCWAFVEQDEIKEGPLALELYKKPADFKRKSLKLLTVKPLYLHLQLNMIQ